MELKVMTFNIRCCGDGDGLQIPDRAPRLRSIIDECDPDLIGLQEYTPTWAAELDDYYKDKYELFLKYRGEHAFEGTPMMWRRDRFECLKKGYYWLDYDPDHEGPSFGDGCYRICMWATLKDKNDGKVFTYINTHFGFGDVCQTNSADLVYKKYLELGEGECFVTADYNMEPGSAGYAEMTKHFADANPDDTRPTYHDYYRGDRLRHIDYCFITGGITPKAVRLLDDMPDGNYPSDHYGLLFNLEIK